jgi:ferredoxin
VIEAIGGGKRAAEAIDRYLKGIPQPKMPPVPVRRGRIDYLEVPANTKMTLKRPEMPLLNIDRRRTTFQQVELGYPENSVREEARRCLRCDICLRCGKCVEVCRDKMGVDALQMGYFDFDHPVQTDFRVTAERCIACGACAANCPTGAMRMEDRGDERILSLCGTILNRQKLLFCEDCGAVLGPARYLDFIRKRTHAVAQAVGKKRLCDACARKSSARAGSENSPANLNTK